MLLDVSMQLEGSQFEGWSQFLVDARKKIA